MPPTPARPGSPAHVLLVFVDGFGWGADDAGINPCKTYGGALFDFDDSPALCKPIDACLGVDGLPQSATGQTALLTGLNAPQLIGHHLTGFPSPRLRELLRRSSIFVQLAARDLDGIFLNAFRPIFFNLPEEQKWRLSATTVAHLAAGRPFFGLDDIAADRAVYQEFTNLELMEMGFDVPEFTPERAGRILAENASRRDFTLYEFFRTDRAGHAQDRERCEEELRNLERFLASALAEIDDDVLVLLTSDHGNIEDLSTRSHTRNPVPLMAWGPGATDVLRRCRDITHVTPAVLGLLAGDADG